MSLVDQLLAMPEWAKAIVLLSGMLGAGSLVFAFVAWLHDRRLPR